MFQPFVNTLFFLVGLALLLAAVWCFRFGSYRAAAPGVPSARAIGAGLVLLALPLAALGGLLCVVAFQ